MRFLGRHQATKSWYQRTALVWMIAIVNEGAALRHEDGSSSWRPAFLTNRHPCSPVFGLPDLAFVSPESEHVVHRSRKGAVESL